MGHLHKKFQKKIGRQISYSLFCRIRPFWVISPKLHDRDTCKCLVHDNLQLKIEKLRQLNMITTTDLNILMAQVCCVDDSKECMYPECSKCSTKKVEAQTYEPSDKIFYYEWRQRKETYEKMDEGQARTISYKITVKEKVESTKRELFEQFQADLYKICSHVFRVKHQFQELRKLKENLPDHAAVIHIDFSENFNCGYSSEVQSAHFGGSHRQATLHTGVTYVEGKVVPFCTISACNRHDPCAIWAHLQPILKYIKENHPKISEIHFISDGPTTQYRNRKNMFLFSRVLFEQNFKLGSTTKYNYVP